jgi:hypothetical protein
MMPLAQKLSNRPQTMATWGTARVAVRYVRVTTAHYVPDATGVFVLVNRKDATRNPRAVTIATVTTKAKRETGDGRLYRIDMTATARDRATLLAFREQQTFSDAIELWAVGKPMFTTVNYC